MKIVIPARLNSRRVPRKPLQVIKGGYVIEWTCRNAMVAAAELGAEVIVATDSEDVHRVVKRMGIRVIVTDDGDRRVENGTERLALVAEYLKLPLSEIVINVQGDNWEVSPIAIRQLAAHMKAHSFGSLYRRHRTLYCLCEELADGDRDKNSIVKVVTCANDNALFFTRANVLHAHKHCGIYGQYVSFLHTYTQMEQRTLERNESLEQMRVLENGGIVCCPKLTGISTAGRSINVPEDLIEANLDVSA